MNGFDSFTGGVLETNCFFHECPSGNVLFDAPQGSDLAFASRKVDLLVLTHGHFDHVADAAAIKARYKCPVAMHPLTVPMVADRGFFQKWGFQLEVEPVTPDRLIEEGSGEVLGEEVRFFHVPGHCPGSLCIYFPANKVLIGGDVLFHGGIGRWDLPGGDFETLVTGIQEKLLPLPEETQVLPGHGPATTIGREKATNSYIR